MIYLSSWFYLVYLIYTISSIFNISIIKDYMNPYYIIYLLLIGFILHSLYLFKNGFRPELSYYIIILIIHVFPILSINNIKFSNKNHAIKTLMVTIVLYIFYMTSINRYIYQVYDIENQPQSWKGYLEMCQKDEYFPFCLFFRNDVIKKYISNNNSNE